MSITREMGVQGPQIKMFFADGGVDPNLLETLVNTWLTANFDKVIFDINYELIERVQPSPDLYTHSCMVVYK